MKKNLMSAKLIMYACGVAFCALTGNVRAESSVVTLIVPYAAGGGTDILARQFAQSLGKSLQSTVVVENKPGAGGNIGAGAVVKSAPDGKTLLLGDMALAVSPSIMKTMSFDPVKDLTPISYLANAPLVLIVDKNLNVKSVKELVQLANDKPGTVTFASAGYGNPPYLAGEQFKKITNTDITHVPYKGVGPALNDLIGGHVSMLFTGISSSKPQIDAGNVIALAVTGDERAPTLPNVPTMKEAGFPQADVTSWWGLFGPANMTAGTIKTLDEASAKAFEDPSLQERMRQLNINAHYGDSKSIQTKLVDETKKWRDVLKDAKMKID